MDSDVESELSGSVASESMDIASASSHSSYEIDSMRSNSPVSVISINSTTQFFRNEHGRLLNTQSDIYYLPADEEELDRQDKQHRILGHLQGYKYVPGMHQVMADDDPDERKTCLDVGCGSGSWIIDVSRDFPHCRAVAVDLIPLHESILPPNLRSEVDDVNMGLQHFFNSFHVVHTRLIASGVRDYFFLIDQLARVVRPGGLIDLTEYDFQTYDQHGRVIPVDENEYSAPWYARWLSLLRKAMDYKGGDVNAATNLHSWVAENPAFEDVGYREHFLPVVSPRESLRGVADDMQGNIMSFVRAGRPILFDLKLPPNYLFDLEEKVEREINERQVFQYTRLQCVYARRRVDYVLS